MTDVPRPWRSEVSRVTTSSRLTCPTSSVITCPARPSPPPRHDENDAGANRFPCRRAGSQRSLQLVARKCREAREPGVQALRLSFAHRLQADSRRLGYRLWRCNRRNRISAARGSETARSRKARSLSASEGGVSRQLVLRGETRLTARGRTPLAYRPSSDRARPSSRRRRTMRACSPGSI